MVITRVFVTVSNDTRTEVMARTRSQLYSVARSLSLASGRPAASGQLVLMSYNTESYIRGHRHSSLSELHRYLLEQSLD